MSSKAALQSLSLISSISRVFAVAHGIAAVVSVMIVDLVEHPFQLILVLFYCMAAAGLLVLLYYWSENKYHEIRRCVFELNVHDAVKREMRRNAYERS